jgi:hypothetical protein
MLQWRDDHGFLEVRPIEYDHTYFNKYVGYAQTEQGLALNQARLGLVLQHLEPGADLIDVGIGCGQFLKLAQAAGLDVKGYDVGLPMMDWLVRNRLYSDPEYGHVNASFWDSYEHERTPQKYIQNLFGKVFISIPIFTDRDHARSSKHYRPGEHYWYFTREGLIRHFSELCFELLEENRMEEDLGREDIGTFVFQRKS